MDRLSLLRTLSFGSQVAEEEIGTLAAYFVETNQWNRIVRGDIDIVRGEKGAGKSAIYLLLTKHQTELFDRGVLIVNAENPRGQTVFKDLILDPPTGEAEFIVLWKLYLLVIICHELRALGLDSGELGDVYRTLEDAQLMERELNLSSVLRAVQSFARRLLRAQSLEGGVLFDPNTGVATGLTGKITLAEPSAEQRDSGFFSVDSLLKKVNAGLSKSNYAIWVLLDRLDVAFAESHELEANALRALVRTYSDLRGLDNIDLKIFIRNDIWNRITESGLREASHIVKYEMIEWNNESLLNLIMRRILNNESLVRDFSINSAMVLRDAAEQVRLFSRLFPAQVEQGPQKASTFKWMVTRCADSTGKTAPRELIHLLNSVKDQEIRRLERGGATLLMTNSLIDPFSNWRYRKSPTLG